MCNMNSETNSKRRPAKAVFICTAMPSESVYCREYLERACRFALRLGVYPIAPALFFDPEFDLSDKHIRRFVESWLRSCMRSASEIWVFGEKAHDKYRGEINRQAGLGKIIRYFGNGNDGEFTLKRIVGNEVTDVYETQAE